MLLRRSLRLRLRRLHRCHLHIHIHRRLHTRPRSRPHRPHLHPRHWSPRCHHQNLALHTNEVK